MEQARLHFRTCGFSLKTLISQFQTEDVSGPVGRPITNASIMIVSEEMRITGS